MDKQLIERIAMEEYADITKQYKQYDVVKFLSRCLARIDAERGKEAVGWFVNVNADCDPDNPHFQQVAKQYEGDQDTFPLFLSPTIPEGMALVPVEPTETMKESFYSNIVVLTTGTILRFDNGYATMLAAAQGEK